MGGALLVLITVIICIVVVSRTYGTYRKLRTSDLDALHKRECCFGKRQYPCPTGAAGIGTPVCCQSADLTGPVCGDGSPLPTCDRCSGHPICGTYYAQSNNVFRNNSVVC